MSDVFGQAVKDFYLQHHKKQAKLFIHNRYGPIEEMPPGVYLRNINEMTKQEWLAIKHCSGHVLDVGAGAGSISWILQNSVHPPLKTTALEISPLCCEVMKLRGVKNIVHQGIFEYNTSKKFDTILLMMNGIGLCGSLHGLQKFLVLANKLLAKGGQLIFDSSDVSYLYSKKFPKPANRYYGEIEYRYAYKKQMSNWFYWLYIDRQTLKKIATGMGWKLKLLNEDKEGQYLVQLTRL